MESTGDLLVVSQPCPPSTNSNSRRRSDRIICMQPLLSQCTRGFDASLSSEIFVSLVKGAEGKKEVNPRYQA